MSNTNNVYDIHIRSRIREELNRLGISIKDAADSSGGTAVDYQSLRDVLGGRKKASAAIVARLASIGADAIYILTGTRSGDAPPAPPQQQPPIDPRERALLDHYRACGEDGKRAVYACSHALAQQATMINEPAPAKKTA